MKTIDLNYYDHDVDFDENFCNLIELTCVDSTNVQNSLNEKFLNYKKIQKNHHYRNIDSQKNEHIYTNETFHFIFEIGILSSRMIYKIKKNLKKQILKFKAR